MLIILVFSFSTGVGILAGVFAGFLRSAPTLEQVEFNPDLTTYMYDINGDVIARFYNENRIKVPLDVIPKDLQNAFIAVEDDQFRHHYGIDFRHSPGLVDGYQAGRHLSRGEQSPNNWPECFPKPRATWSRKLRELLWTIQIERKYSKDEILRALNVIWFGHGAYGVGPPPNLFGKSVDQLTLPEAALLAEYQPRSTLLSSPREGSRGATCPKSHARPGYITAQAEEAKGSARGRGADQLTLSPNTLLNTSAA